MENASGAMVCFIPIHSVTRWLTYTYVHWARIEQRGSFAMKLIWLLNEFEMFGRALQCCCRYTERRNLLPSKCDCFHHYENMKLKRRQQQWAGTIRGYGRSSNIKPSQCTLLVKFRGFHSALLVLHYRGAVLITRGYDASLQWNFKNKNNIHSQLAVCN